MTKICADCKYYEYDNINKRGLCKVDEITGAANFCSSARIFFEAKINAPEPRLSLFLENNLQLTKDESDSLAQKILEFLHL